MVKCFIDIWEDMLEFANFVENAEPCNENYLYERVYKPNNIDFERMRCGDEQAIMHYQTILDDITCEDKINGTTIDVVGNRPIISRVLSGNPYNMYKRFRKESLQLNCNICLDMSVSHGVSNGTIKEIGQRVLATIERLELEGHSLGIHAICSGTTSSFAAIMGVRIKEIGMPLELTKISYPLSNPNFLRRFNFYWHTLYKEIEYMSGLGTPLTVRYTDLELTNAISQALGVKTLYLPFTLFKGWDENKIFDYIKDKLAEMDEKIFIDD